MAIAAGGALLLAGCGSGDGRVQAYLTGHGVNAAAVTSVGLGSTRPPAEEANADGSASLPGRAFNRRVEIALRLP